MGYTISTSLELPIAHCLYKGAYSGLCCGNVYRDKNNDGIEGRYNLNSNIFPVQHGHNYKITVNLTIEDKDINCEGMVLDFKLFKKILNSHLGKYDHSDLFTMGNPLLNAYKENFESNNIILARSRIYIWGENENPTAELMAYRWWFELLCKFEMLDIKVSNLEIQVEETSHNCCSYSVNLKENKIPDIDKLVCGIYKIANNKTGKFYIGQSIDIRRRWLTELNNKEYKGISKELVKEFKLYPNAMDWDFSVLEECPPYKLNELEKKWIDFYKAIEYGYNQTKGGDSITYSEEETKYSLYEKNYINKKSSCFEMENN